MYNYYLEIMSCDHLLFAKEIAEKYNIMSSSGAYHTRFVKNYLDQFETYKLSYNTKKGLVRVFSLQSEEKLKQLIINLKLKYDNKSLQKGVNVVVDEKNYKVCLA